jgi:hypothetical protein
MFTRKGDIYTIHENSALKEPSERIVLVREGFVFWAFAFHLLWLLVHRCWRMSAVVAVLFVAIVKIGELLGLSPIAVAAVQLGLQFWLGGAANDCRRAALRRSGYEEVGVVCAESELLAERRYFDRIDQAA